MEVLVDKLLLLLFGIILLAVEENTFILPVWTLLTAMTLAMWTTYFENEKLLYLIYICFLIISFFNPLQIYFLPLFLYCCVDNQSWRFGLIGFFAVAYQSSQFEKGTIWFIMFAGCMAFLLEYKTRIARQLKQELIRQRDNSVELHLALKQNNRELIEKQNYEVYLATLKERNRIAREIHDNVGHMLSRSLLQMGALLIIEKEGTVHDQLLSVKDTLNQAMTSIRESVHDLHDESVDLKQAVLEAVKEMRENYNVRLDYDMSEHVPRNIKYCFIATVKEAMSNIVKHSNGDKVTIFLREHPGLYQLSIEDNGEVSPQRESDGMGLNNMKERVEALYGTFKIQTEEGFHIFISIQKTEENQCG